MAQNNNQMQTANAQATAQALAQKEITGEVLTKIRGMQHRSEIRFPANYSPENALHSAMLTLAETLDKNNRPALDVCTRPSVANCLLRMVSLGLNPAKKQCYFIVRGNQLTLSVSYFGNVHIAKSVNPNIEDIYADVVYEGDVFTYSKKRGRTIVTEHSQKLGNVDKRKIIAAYCTVVFKDDTEDTTIMTIADIYQAWTQSSMRVFGENGALNVNSVHGKFTTEMCKKTVVNRATKKLINTSDDSNLLAGMYEEAAVDAAEAEALNEIDDNANAAPIEMPESFGIDPDTGEVTEPTATANEVDLP